MLKIIDRLRLLMLYLTAFALLTGQGVSAHVHLTEAHHHNDSHHQHSIEVHTDHFVGGDVSPENHSSQDHVNAVELEPEYRTPTDEKHQILAIGLAYAPPLVGVPGPFIKIVIPPPSDGWFDYLEFSTRRSRAPPANL